MLARSKWWEFVQTGVIAAMFVNAAVRWSSVPDRIPIHWNISGEVDGYGGKFADLMMVPLLTLGLYALLLVIPKLDPARANYPSFRGPYTAIRVALVLYMGAVYVLLNLAIGDEKSVPVGELISASMAVLFVCIGLVLGKVRPNYFVGIRTPWTLTSKKSWIKTHRVGGWVFLLVGAVSAEGAILGGPWAIILMMATLIPGTVFLVVYSYLVWLKDTERVSAQDTRPGADDDDT